MKKPARDTLDKLKKVARFTAIYGPRRTAQKALGRLRLERPVATRAARHLPRAGLIGCGQFAFATLGFFLKDRAAVTACYDLDARAARSLARSHRGCVVAPSAEAVFADPHIDVVFVASNHASHASYAVDALQAGKRVYVEKPVAVTVDQLRELSAAARRAPDRLWAGYNRPFSRAVRDLKQALGSPQGPLSLSCFVSGHVLPDDHWYRRAEEGTRICGNVGHWLDLAVHLLAWRGLPDRWRVSLAWSDPQQRDENLAINLVSEAGDLVNLVLTARTEPFEGIRESIELQWSGTIASIDDFRRLTVWQGDRLQRRRYWPKDVGHKDAVGQAFGGGTRPFAEVVDSSLLMLQVMEMVKTATATMDFSFVEARRTLEAGSLAAGRGVDARS